jgi:hypothetical protein
MFFSSIVRSISCTDEKNQNNPVRLRSDLHRNCSRLGAKTGGVCFLARLADEKQPAPGRSGLGSLITLARDPRFCYENYFQSISHRLHGWLNQKQGEK